ncbi:MAG TPA: hypothetical protein VLJ39_13955 [Tepidisphaeraceae bacterium]|nr:hypothetical protein [Tepidisphaeraceae bacterium]
MPDSSVQPLQKDSPVELTYLPGKRSFRRRFGWHFRSWARTTFSRESFVSSLKSLAWVAPLTVLIWIYAEREQVVPLSNIVVTLETRASESGRVIRVVSPAGGTLHVDLKGPQAQLDPLKDYLESSTIPLEINRNLQPGEHLIPITAELNKMPRVASSGVTVTNCVPGEIRVIVDPIKEWDLEVKVRPEDVQTLSGPQVFTPAKVRISGPQSVVERAIQLAGARGQTLGAYANLAPFKHELSQPGKHTLSSVAVVPSITLDDPSVTISPATVTANVEVTDKAERKYTLPYVRVLAAYPPDPRGDQYKAVYDPTIPTVTVIGPEQEISQLEAGKYSPSTAPTAIFEVNYSDIESPAPAPLIFRLPPGVHVSEQDAQRKITYTLKPRTAEPQ